MNSYSYANNNPTTYKDPNGKAFVVDDLVGFILGGVVGATVETIGSYVAGDNQTAGKFVGAFVTGGIIGWGAINTPETLGVSNAVSASITTGLIAGFYGDLTGQLIDQQTGKQKRPLDVLHAGKSGLVIAGTNVLLGALVPDAQIPRVSGGSNSFKAIGESVKTKTTNGTINSVSVSTAIKSAVGSQGADLYRTLSGLLSSISRALHRLAKK